MKLFCWEIKKLRKRKTARERCDCRGIGREESEQRRVATDILRREIATRENFTVDL